MTLLPLLLAAGLLLAGCSGGKSSSLEAPPPERLPSLLADDGDPQAVSAGEADGYEPTGEIVADSGFRPWEHGFSFENYGNDVGPQNMTPEEMEDLFGSQVCESGTGDTCVLTPVAQHWMETENERMGGGHCMGFSVTANQFFAGVRDPADYGGGVASGLPIVGNVELQELIAQNWTYQDLPAVTGGRVIGSPTDILDALAESLEDEEGELYTVAFFKRDGTGGHAVTPFAIEDKGDGQYAILVYDNNFPGIVRAIEVDANEETWRYLGGTNPDDLGHVYDGDDETESLMLYPQSPADEEYQPCHFCSGEGVDPDDPATGSVPADSERFDQITLTGSPTDHAHLVLEDEEGRVTGFVDGKIVNGIPGVQVARTLSGQTWNVAPEPTYLVPKDTAITATIDGSALTKPQKHTITLIGTGAYVEVDEILVRPGEQNVIEFQGGETGFIFHTDENQDQTPIFSAAIQEGENFYVASGAAVGVKGGSVFTMYFETDGGHFAIDTEGTKGGIDDTGYAAYILSFLRSTPEGDSEWGTDELLIKRGELALLDYRNAPPKGEPLPIVTASPAGEPTGEDVFDPAD